MTDINSRIKEVIDNSGLKPYPFAKKYGLSASYINEICKKVKTPSENFARSFATKVNINLNWLLSGEGEPKSQTDQNIDILRQSGVEVIDLRDKVVIDVPFYINLQDVTKYTSLKKEFTQDMAYGVKFAVIADRDIKEFFIKKGALLLVGDNLEITHEAKEKPCVVKDINGNIDIKVLDGDLGHCVVGQVLRVLFEV